MNVTWSVAAEHEVEQTILLMYYASDVGGLDELFNSYQDGNFKYLQAISPVLEGDQDSYTFRCRNLASLHLCVTRCAPKTCRVHLSELTMLVNNMCSSRSAECMQMQC